MKKLTLILCVVVAMAFAGMVFASTATPPQKQTPAQPVKTTLKEPVAKPIEQKKMMEGKAMGVVVSVDAVANTFVVKHGKRGDLTFQAVPTTKIMIAGKEAKLVDIKKNSKATITYKWEGKKRVASAITCG